MTQNALTVPTQPGSLAVLDAISGGASFMPRLQLMTSKSPTVEAGKFPVNHYALISGSKYEDLGEEVIVIPLSYRATAMSTANGDFVVCHDPKPDEKNNPTGLFLEIMQKATIPDSGCFYGPEFLLWLPEQKCFATMLLGSRTARNETGSFVKQLGKVSRLHRKLIDTKKYKYQSLDLLASSAEVTNKPADDELATVVEKFLNPPVAAEQATAEEVKAQAEAR
jgi:hypothetical protein